MLQVAPFAERLIARRVVAPSSASVEISHVPCAASYATTGSLARAFGPGGRLAVVRPGRRPLRHEAPSSVVTAQPTLVAAPSKRRPTWKAATVVRPNVKLSGSTSVSCCASEVVYGSRERRRPTTSQSRATASAQVGVDDVETGSAPHDVAPSVVRGRDEIVTRPCVVRVPARAALQEVGAAPGDEPVVPAEAAQHVRTRRSEEPVVAGRPGHDARAGRGGGEEQDDEHERQNAHTLDWTRPVTHGLHSADYDPVP